MSRAAAALALAALLVGCAPAAPPVAQRARGPVVARVAGEAVHADEVAAVARLERVSAREALDRIVRDRLLAREALRAGVATADDTDDARWRGRIQRLLARDIEAALTPDTLPGAFFEELYQRRRVAYHHDGLVQVVHALAPLEGAAAPGPAADLAARFRARLRAEGATPTAERFEALVAQFPGLRFERVPAFDRTGQSEDGNRFADAFVRVAWTLRPDAPVSEPFATPFGVHVVLRVGDAPPRTRPLAEVRAAVVAEGVTGRRARALTELLERLRAAADVRVSETAIASTGTAPQAP